MVKCHVCGKEFENETAYCADCGTKLNHEEPAAAPGAQYTAVPEDKAKPLGMWDYFLMEFISKVPVLNLVMFFIWGFTGEANENKKNWSRSKLIWAAIGLVLSIAGIALTALLGTVAFSVVDEVSKAF